MPLGSSRRKRPLIGPRCGTGGQSPGEPRNNAASSANGSAASAPRRLRRRRWALPKSRTLPTSPGSPRGSLLTCRPRGKRPEPVGSSSIHADAPVPPALHELEEAVMQVIWAHDEICVREVMQALNGQGPARASTTYMTIMPGREARARLLRPRRGKTDFYRAAHTRERYADLRAGAAIDAIVE